MAVTDQWQAERESDELDRAYNSARDRYLVAIDRRSRFVFTGLVPPHIDQVSGLSSAAAFHLTEKGVR